jgi:aspartate racemase
MVAVSPVGASLCNRQIFRHAREKITTGDDPIVTIHNLPLARYIAAIRADDWHTVAAMLRQSAAVLAGAGAEICFTPDNMVQHAVPMVATTSAIPWINMADIVADAVAADSRAVVGIIGTTIVTSGSTYQATLGMRGVKIHKPTPEEAEIAERIIFKELAYGSVLPDSLKALRTIAHSMRDRGCDALLFGCSEGPALEEGGDWPLPTYDACTIVAGEVLRRACEG